MTHTALPLILTLASAGCAAAEERSLSYLPRGTPQVGGVRHLCLIYHGMERRVSWTKDAIMPYVAHVDEDGRPRDWLFDSFLFIEFSTDERVQLHHAREGAPLPTIADWQWLAETWFRENTGLVGLERAVEEAALALGEPDHTVNVVITLPIPLSPIKAFGPLPGEAQPLDFTRESDRQAALRWYIDAILDRWQQRDFKHLNLVGFYWLAETIPSADNAIVEWTAAHIYGLGYKLYWVPYFGARGVPSWRDRGIDAVMLQPNHFFTPEPDVQRLLAAAKKARMAGTGIEIEFDGRALDSEDHRQRFWAYLDAGVKYGWMKDAILGYYEGGGAVRMFAERPGLGRELYDAVHRFVKGTYEPSGKVDLSNLNLIERDNTDNLALASKGARIVGCIRRDDEPELVPEKIIDGDIDFYGGMSGFGYFAWPGSFTVELPEASTVARTQTMLWDLDGRHFRYRIETSLDADTWELAADKSEGEWVGWQLDTFPARRARYLRFTGLYNSENSLFQVVEFEAYPTP